MGKAIILHAMALGCPIQYLRMECGMPAKGAAKHHQIAINRAATTCPECKRVVDREPKPNYGLNAKPEHEAWANGPDSGTSSKTILSAITGVQFEKTPSTPGDPDDFGRCSRLLAKFPDLRGQLQLVAEKHPAWTGLVAHWDELERLYAEERPTGRAPKLYLRIQELTEAVSHG